MESLYITKVVRIGTSLGIIIPKNITKGINWQRGDTILFTDFGVGQLTARLLTSVEVNALKKRVEKL